MMALTHAAFSVALTSVTLGTGNPIVLAISAIASQLPDVDTSKSHIGRILFPISNFLENRFAHRSISHSFLATGIVTFISLPLLFFINGIYWQALVLGYFLGWFADVFTKSGVAAFYPSKARLVIPGNPRLRLSTGSNIELFLLILLTAIAIVSINLNLNGGLIKQFDRVLGMPSTAIETVNEEISQYLLEVEVKGYDRINTKKIDRTYEVVKPISENELLVKDEGDTFYLIGNSQASQIVPDRIKVNKIASASVFTRDVYLDLREIGSIMQQLPEQRVYISGTLEISDPEDLDIPVNLNQFDTISKVGSQVKLTAAPPKLISQKLGNYYGTGNIIIRAIDVQ
ncbi:MAG: metal-dependent hydrolase [Prochloraceae cyanobacterium]|nr:metal-dependent hydrolase [Prochloraceae cyanobacterium]